VFEAAQRDRGEHRCRQKHRRLRDDEQTLAVDGVGDHAADE
jgi:hypothetical protein